ncbi:MAG: hypothetical protein FWE03_07025 [Firmicutes bacterium]|nr:hypothetical protein [Bacillota bacterium]
MKKIRKILNTVLFLGMALIMLFSIAFFGATNCEGIKPNPCGQNPCVCLSTELLAYRADAISVLNEHANARGEDNFSSFSWQRIKDYIDDGAKIINVLDHKPSIDTIVEHIKVYIDAVEMVEWIYSYCGNFALAISLNDTIFNIGDYLKIDIILKNIGGEDLYILRSRYWSLFEIYIEFWIGPPPPSSPPIPRIPDPVVVNMYAGAVFRELREIWLWEPSWMDFEPGLYEIYYFGARFHIYPDWSHGPWFPLFNNIEITVN